jgi:site-specific DNA-methyltransferase (adenine-specific)
MNRTTINLNEIIVENRQREDLGDIPALAESIKRYGLIQPIVSSLGLKQIDVVFRETLTEDELYEMELEENVRRKDFTWQERVLNIATIHSVKKRRATLEGAKWGQKETAEALGLDSACSVNYSLKIAERLRQGKDNPVWNCDSMMEAYRLLLREEEDAINKELAKRQLENSFNFEAEEVVVKTTELSNIVTQVTDDEHKRNIDDRLRMILETDGLVKYCETVNETPYLRNRVIEHWVSAGNTEESFEGYWSEKTAKAIADSMVNLSRMLIHGNSIEFMNANPDRFDHVITDIPYGIDMDMLNQQNPHNGMKDIDTVLEEHDVEYNLKLIAEFFPAAFKTVKDGGFVITWCDQMLWQYMYDHAIKAGFKVQRWPITWDKTHTCLNQSAQYNFTKSTEIAIVCRKGKATLVSPQTKCIVQAGRDELCQSLGHPFAKPRAIWKFLADAVSIEGQTILEPFAGRGSGVISMLGMKRNVVGVELNEAHYNALLENVKTLHFLPLNPSMKFK